MLNGLRDAYLVWVWDGMGMRTRPKLIVQLCNMLLYSILFVVNYLECTQNQLGLRKGMNFFLISHPYEARKFSLDNMSFCFRMYHVA